MRGDPAFLIDSDTCRRAPLRIYLRLLAACYVFGAAVHYANMLGFGELPWVEAPLSWKLGDLFYAPLDTAAAVGLWRRKPWGIACFLLAAGSQILLYGLCPDLLAATEDHREALRGMLLFHVVTVATFILLFAHAKRG